MGPLPFDVDAQRHSRFDSQILDLDFLETIDHLDVDFQSPDFDVEFPNLVIFTILIFQLSSLIFCILVFI